MPLQVLVLYPPPALSAGRVACDLAHQQHSPHPLRWLNLQEDFSDSIRSSTPSRPATIPGGPSQSAIGFQPPRHRHAALGGLPDKFAFSSTAVTSGPSTRPINRNKESLRARKSSRSVTFDLTHEIAAIPFYEASLDDVEEDPRSTSGKTAEKRIAGSAIESSGFLGNSEFHSPKKRKHDSIFVRQDLLLQQSVTTSSKIPQRNSDRSRKNGKASRSRPSGPTLGLSSFSFQEEYSQEKNAEEKTLEDAEVARDLNLPPVAFSIDADDEDSCPVRPTLYSGSSSSASRRHAPREGLASRRRPSSLGPTPEVTTANIHEIDHSVEQEHAVPEAPLHDITNFSYGGAVDSQSQSSQRIVQDDHKDRKNAYQAPDLAGMQPAPVETQLETQFSAGSQSWQGGTYQTYRPAASGTSGLAPTAITSTSAEPASFAPYHNLPIINIASLSYIDDLRDGGANPHAQLASPGISVLAVVFEIGELKDIPRRRSEKAALGKGYERNLKLCTIKICQPNAGGWPKMTMIDVSVSGDMADRISSGDYRLVKGDVVWFKNLLYKADSGGHDCSLHTRCAPASDYHIFYRTFPRIKQKPRRGERRTVEEVIDQRLRAIELVKNEPGARRALSLAKWITEAWS